MIPVIRTLEPKDSAEIKKLIKTLGYSISENYTAARIQRLKTQKHNFARVITLNGTIAGFVHAATQDFFHDVETVEIIELVTDEAVHGLGFGSDLLDAVEKWAKSKGVKKIILRSNVMRTDAHTFYLGRHYKILKTAFIFGKTV